MYKWYDATELSSFGLGMPLASLMMMCLIHAQPVHVLIVILSLLCTVLPAYSGHFCGFCYYLMFFSYKTVIIKVFVLKLGDNVGTSFIFSLANFGRSSMDAYVVITTK